MPDAVSCARRAMLAIAILADALWHRAGRAVATASEELWSLTTMEFQIKVTRPRTGRTVSANLRQACSVIVIQVKAPNR
jgi:hypothetical protein